MTKYLRVRLKSGDSKLFVWDNVEFDSASGYLKVWEKDTKEMLLIVPLVNIEYYERMID